MNTKTHSYTPATPGHKVAQGEEVSFRFSYSGLEPKQEFRGIVEELYTGSMITVLVVDSDMRRHHFHILERDLVAVW